MQLKLNRTTLENENLTDDLQEKDRELEASNKIARMLEDNNDQLDDIRLGTESVVKTKIQELERANYKIQ